MIVLSGNLVHIAMLQVVLESNEIFQAAMWKTSRRFMVKSWNFEWHVEGNIPYDRCVPFGWATLSLKIQKGTAELPEYIGFFGIWTSSFNQRYPLLKQSGSQFCSETWRCPGSNSYKYTWFRSHPDHPQVHDFSKYLKPFNLLVAMPHHSSKTSSCCPAAKTPSKVKTPLRGNWRKTHLVGFRAH